MFSPQKYSSLIIITGPSKLILRRIPDSRFWRAFARTNRKAGSGRDTGAAGRLGSVVGRRCEGREGDGRGLGRRSGGFHAGMTLHDGDRSPAILPPPLHGGAGLPLASGLARFYWTPRPTTTRPPPPLRVCTCTQPSAAAPLPRDTAATARFTLETQIALPPPHQSSPTRRFSASPRPPHSRRFRFLTGAQRPSLADHKATIYRLYTAATCGRQPESAESRSESLNVQRVLSWKSRNAVVLARGN